jgi:hypothetical protein
MSEERGANAQELKLELDCELRFEGESKNEENNVRIKLHHIC